MPDSPPRQFLLEKLDRPHILRCCINVPRVSCRYATRRMYKVTRFNGLRIVSLLLSLAFASQVTAETPETVSQIEINNPTKKQLLQIWKWGLDVEGEENNIWTIFAKPADLERLSGAGIPYSVSIPDMQSFYRSRNKDNKTMGGFRTFA